MLYKLSLFSRDKVEKTIREARQSEMLGLAILVLVLALSPVIIALVRSAVNTIQVEFISHTLSSVSASTTNKGLKMFLNLFSIFGIVFPICVSSISRLISQYFSSNRRFLIQMYATHLSEKAQELKREKQLSDTLLCQMLPPSVAQRLKREQQVPAEFFSAVTIYFSDIEGFTEIAAGTTPLQVSTLK